MGTRRDIILKLAARVVAGERSALARAITLTESSRIDHSADAAELLQECLRLKSPKGPEDASSIRIAVAGPPGAGKSTLLESLGSILVDRNERVAVLSIDPSSVKHGGSILGDMTRMPKLASHPQAFVRPSPARGHLGGLGAATAEAIELCEAAGFTIVFVETVGLGQSEVAAAGVSDIFCLALPPGAGDSLQGLKRGIVEHADIITITKADGPLLGPANVAVAEYKAAMHVLGRSLVPVMPTSAFSVDSLDSLWNNILSLHHADIKGMREKRKQQLHDRFTHEVYRQIMTSVRNDDQVNALIKGAQEEVILGRLSPRAAARTIMETWEARKP